MRTPLFYLQLCETNNTLSLPASSNGHPVPVANTVIGVVGRTDIVPLKQVRKVLAY